MAINDAHPALNARTSLFDGAHLCNIEDQHACDSTLLDFFTSGWRAQTPTGCVFTTGQ